MALHVPFKSFSVYDKIEANNIEMLYHVLERHWIQCQMLSRPENIEFYDKIV